MSTASIFYLYNMYDAFELPTRGYNATKSASLVVVVAVIGFGYDIQVK